MSSPELILSDPRTRAELARARGAFAAHDEVFRALEQHALDTADPLGAAVRAQIAIDYGVRNHTGRLVAPRLERLLNEIGREHVVPAGAGAARAGAPGGPERVLHVLSEAYDTGGHTRVVERWVTRDAGRVPTVVLTGQVGPLPATLPQAAAARGGELIERLEGDDLLERARALRRLAAGHDLVVLHHHMHDVLPALAFADPAGRPPTILFNHASHLLWIGVGAADVVANLWGPDDAATRARRGVAADRSLVLPLPVAPRTLPSREEARAHLGLPAGVRLVLAVGHPHKMRPVLEPAFTDIARTLLERNPAASLVVAGPAPEGPWAELARATGGRAQALGPVADLAPLLAAAELLLDSWPASGATTLLDAGAAGLPVLSLGDGRPELATVRPPAGTLGGAVVHAPTAEGLAARAAALLADDERRAVLGAAARAHVAREHDEGWGARLEAVVATARAHAGAAALPGEVDTTVVDWECVMHLLREGDGHTTTPVLAYMSFIRGLPEHLRPADVAATVDELLAAARRRGRRGVAAPPVRADAISRLVADVRARVAAGEITSCAIAVPSDQLDAAIPLLERALAEGDDVDLDVLAAASAEEVAGPDDLVLSAS